VNPIKVEMKIRIITTIGALVILGSLFVPWITNAEWWLDSRGNIVELAEKSFQDLAYCNNVDCLKSIQFYQGISVLGCFIFLAAAAIIALYHQEWMGHLAPIFAVTAMLLFSLISLEFFTALRIQDLNLGYFMGWGGSILIGWGVESEK
jgi:hypothetical protein